MSLRLVLVPVVDEDKLKSIGLFFMEVNESILCFLENALPGCYTGTKN